MSKKTEPPKPETNAFGHRSTVTIPRETYEWLLERSERLKGLEK